MRSNSPSRNGKQIKPAPAETNPPAAISGEAREESSPLPASSVNPPVKQEAISNEPIPQKQEEDSLGGDQRLSQTQDLSGLGDPNLGTRIPALDRGESGRTGPVFGPPDGATQTTEVDNAQTISKPAPINFETQTPNLKPQFESQIVTEEKFEPQIRIKSTEFESQTQKFGPLKVVAQTSETKFETQTPVLKPKPVKPEDPDKPPRVMPNTYWSRKGSGWVLEMKKKTGKDWQYEYYGMLKLETWLKLKGIHKDEKLKQIIKAIVISNRNKLKPAGSARPDRDRLRIAG